VDESASHRITLGRVGKTHGIKGWLKLYSYTDPPSNITEYSEFIATRGQWHADLVMDQVRAQGKALVAHFEGYDDPEAAQALVGVELQVAVSDLPALEPDQFYWHQLTGLTVINGESQVLGVVDNILETGANDVLVVKGTETSIDRQERLIPFLRDTVIKKIDLEQGVIEVEWGADYLL